MQVKLAAGGRPISLTSRGEATMLKNSAAEIRPLKTNQNSAAEKNCLHFSILDPKSQIL
jgi:hypothetical protein